MSDARKRVDLRVGDLALSVQGVDEPLPLVKQVLRFVQRLVEETPEMTGAGVTLDDETVAGLLRDLEARGGVPEGSFTVTPGLILTAGTPETAVAKDDGLDAPAPAARDDAPAMPGADWSYDDPDEDAPLGAGLAEDDPAQAEPAPEPEDRADRAGAGAAMAGGAGVLAAAAGLGAREEEGTGRGEESAPAEAEFQGWTDEAPRPAGLADAPAEPSAPEGGDAPDDDAILDAPAEAPPVGAVQDPVAPDELEAEVVEAQAGPAEAGDAPPADGPPAGAAAQPADEPEAPLINIFAQSQDAPAPTREEARAEPRVSIFSGPETGGAAPRAGAPAWIEDPDEPAPEPSGTPGEAGEAPATSRFDELVARYRRQGGEGSGPAPEPAPPNQGATPPPASKPEAEATPLPTSAAEGEAPDAATLARLSGAEDVADLLAASAAALALGGRRHFSRREVMEVFDTLPGDHPRSLEARIKGYGKLVRGGSLVLVEDGLFELSDAEEERFRALLR